MSSLLRAAGSILSAAALCILAAPASGSVLLVATCGGGNVAIPIAPDTPSRREDGACHAICLHRRLHGAESDGEA